MRWMLLLVAALAGAAAADDPPSPVSVRAAVMPARTTIGTPARYEVTVSAPAGMAIVVAQPADRIGDLEIVDFGQDGPTPTRDGRVYFQRWWQLVAWRPGRHLLPSPKVQYRVAGGELVDVPGADVTVEIESLLERAKDATDIRDIKPPEAIPIDWRPYYGLGGAVLLLAVVAWLLYRLRTRARRARPAAPPPEPHVIANGALDALRARGLVEQGAFKEFYSALSDIVRRYLEDRFRVRAPEMTTEEFLVASSRDGSLAPGHRRLLGDFLAESDLVKFARHLPAITDSTRAFDAARRFVGETAPVPAPSAERARAAG